MDPETGLDAVMNVEIRDGRIDTISADAMRGDEVVDVSGLVVAPGFIDSHAHGQDPFSRVSQVRDGELVEGVMPGQAIRRRPIS